MPTTQADLEGRQPLLSNDGTPNYSFGLDTQGYGTTDTSAVTLVSNDGTLTSYSRTAGTNDAFQGSHLSNSKQSQKKQYPSAPSGEDVIVDFDGEDDPNRPLNWSFAKKCWTTGLYGLTTFGATCASAIYSQGGQEVAEEFGVRPIVASLGTLLLLFGFGFGPLLFAPLSEIYGRKLAVFPAYFVGIAFTFGTAAAKDIQTVLITRFFTGLFSSAPVTCSGGVLSDIWDPPSRGTALQFYAMTVLGGPLLSPIAGGAIIAAGWGWRWLEYVTGILMIVIFILGVLILDESYVPALLTRKASELRKLTGNWAIHAKHEEWAVSFEDMAKKFLITPFLLMLTPILFLMSTYAAFVYGLLYLTVGSFPIVFEEVRGWDKLVAQLPFLSLFCGIVCGAGINILNNGFYFRKYRENGGKAVPEARLPPMMAGSMIFCVGLFLFGWTSVPEYPWIWPCIGGVFIGIGFITIFQGALNYLIDTFQIVSASAVAAQTFLRSVFAGVFPVIAAPLYHDLGTDWGSYLLAFIALAMIPIPFLFFWYGPKIRARGKWTKQFSEV